MECALGALDDYIKAKAAFRPEVFGTDDENGDLVPEVVTNTADILDVPANDSASQSKIPAIAGGVVGGGVFLILLVGGFIYYQKLGGEDSASLVEASEKVDVAKRVIENPLYAESSTTD